MTQPQEFEGDHDPTELEDIPDQGGGLGLETIKQPIRNIMRTDVGTVRPDTTVREAIHEMAQGHYGCVLVIDAGRLVGILSERDVVTRLLDREKDPKTELVCDHMTMEPEGATPDDEIAYALNIMSVGGFRHVPVSHPEGGLAGIVSIRDIARLLVDHFREEILTLAPKTDHGPKTQHGG